MLVSDFQGACLVFQSLLPVMTGWRMQWVKSRFQLGIQPCSNSHEQMWEELLVDLGNQGPPPPDPISIMLTQVDIVANYKYLDVHVDRKGRLPRKLGCRRNSSGDLRPGECVCRGCWEDSAVWMSHTPAHQHLQPKTDHTQCHRSFLHFAPLTVHFLLYLV